MSEREEAIEKAEERYQIDYWGILLNGLVSAFSSVTASGLLAVVESFPPSRFPVIFGAIFLAQLLPKLLIEAQKKYRVKQAKRKGYVQGLLEDKKSQNRAGKLVDYIFSLFEHAAYF